MGAVDTKSRRDERRAVIVRVARAAFVKDGCAATSMSAIAARLGGSKSTLYNYFSSKEDLFRAVVQDGCDQILDLLDEIRLDRGDLRIGLKSFGERFVVTLLSDDFIGMYRIIVVEGARSAEMAAAFYKAGPMQGMKRIEKCFADRIAAGELRGEDPDFMAHYFVDLCLSKTHLGRLWNILPEPPPERIRENVDRAVSIFLKVFGT